MFCNSRKCWTLSTPIFPAERKLLVQELSHSKYYPMAIEIVQKWCAAYGPRACIRKGLFPFSPLFISFLRLASLPFFPFFSFFLLSPFFSLISPNFEVYVLLSFMLGSASHQLLYHLFCPFLDCRCTRCAESDGDEPVDHGTSLGVVGARCCGH